MLYLRDRQTLALLRISYSAHAGQADVPADMSITLHDDREPRATPHAAHCSSSLRCGVGYPVILENWMQRELTRAILMSLRFQGDA